eukprot:4220780-Amphidinium_carterae.1
MSTSTGHRQNCKHHLHIPEHSPAKRFCVCVHRLCWVVLSSILHCDNSVSSAVEDSEGSVHQLLPLLVHGSTQ